MKIVKDANTETETCRTCTKFTLFFHCWEIKENEAGCNEWERNSLVKTVVNFENMPEEKEKP